MTEEGSPPTEAVEVNKPGKTKNQKIRIGILCAVGAIIIAVVYSKFDSEAKAEAIVEVHNTMAGMSRTYANSVSSIQNIEPDGEDLLGDIFEIPATACAKFHAGLKSMDTSECPNDYREAFNKLINLVEKEKQALENEDLVGFMENVMERKKLGDELKSIAVKHGLSFY